MNQKNNNVQIFDDIKTKVNELILNNKSGTVLFEVGKGRIMKWGVIRSRFENTFELNDEETTEFGFQTSESKRRTAIRNEISTKISELATSRGKTEAEINEQKKQLYGELYSAIEAFIRKEYKQPDFNLKYASRNFDSVLKYLESSRFVDDAHYVFIQTFQPSGWLQL